MCLPKPTYKLEIPMTDDRGKGRGHPHMLSRAGNEQGLR